MFRPEGPAGGPDKVAGNGTADGHRRVPCGPLPHLRNGIYPYPISYWTLYTQRNTNLADDDWSAESFFAWVDVRAGQTGDPCARAQARLDTPMRSERHHGIAALYTVIMLIALMGMVSFAVDFGRVQAARGSLQSTADAASRYAVTGISDSTATSKAQAVIAQNTVDGASASAATAVITQGNWSAGTFTANKSPINAVQVKLTKSVPLLFAAVVGRNSFTTSATSISTLAGTAAGTPTSPYGWVGLGWFNLSGSVTVDSYTGTYSAGSASTTTTACNSWYNINGSSTIKGNAEYGSSGGVSMNSPATVTGSKTKITRNFSSDYVTPTAGNAASVNNNSKITGTIPSGGNLNNNSGNTTNLPAGTYYIPNFNIGGTLNLQISSGQNVTIYARDNFNISGRVTVNGSTAGQSASQLTVIMVGSGGVNLSPANDLYADIYAPNSPLNLSANTAAGLYGRGVFAGINVSGTTGLHHDKSLAGSSYYTGPADPNANSGGSGSGIVLVK